MSSLIILLSQADTAAYTDIVAAKKEAVGLQLEAVYRARLQDAYTQVCLMIIDLILHLFIFKLCYCSQWFRIKSFCLIKVYF